MAPINKFIIHAACILLTSTAVFINFAQQPGQMPTLALPGSVSATAQMQSQPTAQQVPTPVEAVPAAPAGKTLKIVNASGWEMLVSYVTPLEAKINIAIEPHTSETVIS